MIVSSIKILYLVRNHEIIEFGLNKIENLIINLIGQYKLFF